MGNSSERKMIVTLFGICEPGWIDDTHESSDTSDVDVIVTLLGYVSLGMSCRVRRQ